MDANRQRYSPNLCESIRGKYRVVFTHHYDVTNIRQTDTLASAASNKVVEGTDVDAPSLSPTTRVGNYTQILRKAWRVSDTQEAIDKAGRDSENSYQMAKKMKELARDIEYALVNGSEASGATGTAREMKGVLNFISTNVETGSGTGDEDLTEEMYNDLLETIWEAGGNPDVTYASGPQKRKISNFSANSTRNIGAESNRLVASVDVYESKLPKLLSKNLTICWNTLKHLVPLFNKQIKYV